MQTCRNIVGRCLGNHKPIMGALAGHDGLDLVDFTTIETHDTGQVTLSELKRALGG